MEERTGHYHASSRIDPSERKVWQDAQLLCQQLPRIICKSISSAMESTAAACKELYAREGCSVVCGHVLWSVALFVTE